jgi:single stranded DNA-binding protein
MAFVRVEQRNAHLAGNVRLEFVNGREGKIAKATVTAISNTRRGSGEEREEESTAIQWTLWGKQAENAAEYLGKGSHVNIVGRLRNNNYQDADGTDVYALAFTAEDIDYLDSKAESDARRARGAGPDNNTGNNGNGNAAPDASAPAGSASRSRSAGKTPRVDRQPAHAGA